MSLIVSHRGEGQGSVPNTEDVTLRIAFALLGYQLGTGGQRTFPDRSFE